MIIVDFLFLTCTILNSKLITFHDMNSNIYIQYWGGGGGGGGVNRVNRFRGLTKSGGVMVSSWTAKLYLYGAVVVIN